MKNVNRNKKLIILLLMGILSVSMFGCASSDTGNTVKQNTENNSRFVDTGDVYTISDGMVKYHISYDSKSNRVYIVCPYNHNSGISLLYNKDGTPMTIEEYNKSNKNKDRFVDTGDVYSISDGMVKYHVCYDSETDIAYIVCPYNHNSGISVMVDSNGKAMTITEYNKTK